MTIDKNKIARVNAANPYVDIIPYELRIGLPFVSYIGFFPQPNEVLIYAAPSSTFEDTEKVIGYKGKSSGVNVRVTKNVSVTTGSSGAHQIRGTVRDFNDGDLLITNKRILFTGKDDSFEFAIGKLSAIKVLDKNSFVLQAGKSSKNIYMDDILLTYAYIFINYVVNETNKGVDVYKAIQDVKNEITEEQMNTYNKIKEEVIDISNSFDKKVKKTSKTLNYVTLTFVMIIILCVAVGGMSNSLKKTLNLPTDSAKSTYSNIDLLGLEGHPVIYSGFEEAKAFYDVIKSDSVKVISIEEYASLQRDIKKFSDDKIMLYLIEHSTEGQFIGQVHINLFEPELYADMNVDKAVDIMASYLPADFLECYDEDISYQYSNNITTIYTYSCRLNKHGIEVSKTDHREYSYYYNFKIIHYGDTNHWSIKSGYSGYGDRSLDWINKYSSPWDIDLSEHIN